MAGGRRPLHHIRSDRRFLICWCRPSELWRDGDTFQWREPVIDPLWIPHDEEDWHSHYRFTTREKAFRYVVRQNIKSVAKSMQFELWHAVAEVREERDRWGETYMQLGVGEFHMDIVYSFDIVIPTDTERALIATE